MQVVFTEEGMAPFMGEGMEAQKRFFKIQSSKQLRSVIISFYKNPGFRAF